MMAVLTLYGTKSLSIHNEASLHQHWGFLNLVLAVGFSDLLTLEASGLALSADEAKAEIDLFYPVEFPQPVNKWEPRQVNDQNRINIKLVSIALTGFFYARLKRAVTHISQHLFQNAILAETQAASPYQEYFTISAHWANKDKKGKHYGR